MYARIMTHTTADIIRDIKRIAIDAKHAEFHSTELGGHFYPNIVQYLNDHDQYTVRVRESFTYQGTQYRPFDIVVFDRTNHDFTHLAQ